MSTITHTPGPWHVEDGFIFAENTLRIADTECDGQEMPEAEQMANARLIAAATDMLEALEAQEMAEHDPEAARRKGYFDAARDLRKAAIAKARGRT